MNQAAAARKASNAAYAGSFSLVGVLSLSTRYCEFFDGVPNVTGAFSSRSERAAAGALAGSVDSEVAAERLYGGAPHEGHFGALVDTR